MLCLDRRFNFICCCRAWKIIQSKYHTLLRWTGHWTDGQILLFSLNLNGIDNRIVPRTSLNRILPRRILTQYNTLSIHKYIAITKYVHIGLQLQIPCTFSLLCSPEFTPLSLSFSKAWNYILKKIIRESLQLTHTRELGQREVEVEDL